MRKIKRDIVSAIIFSKDGKILQGMKSQKQGGVYSNCWHLPGGGVEKGEDKKTALIREIKEETGIDISSYLIQLIDKSGRGESEKTLKDTQEKILCEMKFNVYKVTINDKNTNEITVNLSDDLVKYRWIDLSELKTTELTPPSVELFTKLGYLK